LNGARVLRLTVVSLMRTAFVVSLAGAACRPRPEPPSEPVVEDSPEAAVELPEPFAPPTASGSDSRLAALAVDLTPAGEFAHEPHREVDCSQCHAAPPGHASHDEVECADCHPSATPTQGMLVVGEGDCLRCHHVQQTVQDCAGCHITSTVGPLSVDASLDFSIWEETRTRALPFEHDRHTDLECSRCHEADPGQSVGTECASCHDEHHGEDARCVTCHFPAPLDTHDASAHRGCSGSGCHTNDPAAAPPSRVRCLSCHIEQEEHEPEQECSPCHLLADIAVSDPTGAEAGAGRW